VKGAYLPSGLILATVAGLGVPAPGAAAGGVRLGPVGLVQLLVVAIFLVSGYSIRPGALRFGPKVLKVLGVAALVSLVGAPLVALGAGRALPLEAGVVLGLTAMACVPPTLSSCVVITAQAGGNAALALLLNVTLNLAGVFVLPFTLGACLGSAASVDVDRWALLLKIGMLVMLPLAAGMGLRALLKGRRHGLVSYIPSTAVILTVWMTVSRHRGAVLDAGPLSVVGIAALVIGVHVVLMGLARGGWAALGLERADGLALVFVSSQKTLPLALTVLLMLPERVVGAGLGLAVLTCVLFHFCQVFGDSVLAAHLARRAGAGAEGEG
jgi:sodium/bile acid cotransporter 7